MEENALILLLYGAIGLTGALSVAAFFGGFVVYIVRLGTERRITGIRIVQWAVRLIITSIILIGILNLVQYLMV